MPKQEVSRRGVVAGGVAGTVIAALPGSPVQAVAMTTAEASLPNLNSKIEAVREVTALTKRLGKMRTTFYEDYPPEYFRACARASALMEELFLSPASCGDDVVAKYAMMEEYCIREIWCRDGRDSRGFYGRTINKLFRKYFDLMDTDMACFEVDVHPWWHDRENSIPRLNGQSVQWRDGAWQAFDWGRLKQKSS